MHPRPQVVEHQNTAFAKASDASTPEERQQRFVTEAPWIQDAEPSDRRLSMPGVAPGDNHRSLRGYAFFNRATIIHFPLIRSTAAV